jgi:DNA-binding MarR family transcriptional regulator
LQQSGEAKNGDIAQAASQAGVFGFFNEIGIVAQLSSAMLARVLPDGVHPSHFAIINHLVRLGDGKTPVRIASAMQVTKATMSHSLDVLEDRGFIHIARSDSDQRSKLVWLTPQGRTFRESAVEAVSAEVGRLFSDADHAAMASALPVLRAVRKVLDDNRSGPPAEES